MIKDLSLEKKLGGNEFEVYLPVDKIFEEQFTMLVQKTSLIGCFTFITDQQLYRQAETWLNDKHPLFCKEYLIFYMESEIPKNFTLPGFIDCFNKKKFSYFGKIYMYLKQDNIWYLYDVTHNRHLVTIDSLPNCLLKQIEEEQPTARTFILFEFLGWRQTN